MKKTFLYIFIFKCFRQHSKFNLILRENSIIILVLDVNPTMKESLMLIKYNILDSFKILV